MADFRITYFENGERQYKYVTADDSNHADDVFWDWAAAEDLNPEEIEVTAVEWDGKIR